MLKGIFISGTDTGVGKTLVTAYLTALLIEEKIDAIPYKPIQSGALNTPQGLIAEDVEVYRKVLELRDKQEKYCSYAFEAPLSPHLAANKAGVSISLTKIQNHFNELQQQHEFIVVEGAGGLAVPLIAERDQVILTAELIKKLNLPLIIVTHPGLGTINHTLLTVAYAKSLEIPILGIIMNRWPAQPTEMEQDNLIMIEKLCQVPILGCIPALPAPAEDYIHSHWAQIRNLSAIEKLKTLVKEEKLNERTTRTMG